MKPILTMLLCSGMALAQVALRDAAAQRGVMVGAAAVSGNLGQSSYATALGREFSVVESENDMKWAALHPNPPGSANEYNFAPADALVSFAQSNNQKARGHNLLWHSYNPAWLNKGNYAAAQLNQILRDHINSVVTHYKGRVYAWDVVNEALDDSSAGLRDSIWYNQPGIGETGFGFIAQAFQWAHQADPQALLFYNDYNVEDVSLAKSTAMYNMLKTLLAQGVPIHGVGLQLHVTASPNYISPAGLDANIARLAALGLQVHFTELDVRIPVDSGGAASAGDLKTQAQRYRDIAAVCLKHPACSLIQTWGFTDKYSWIPGAFPGFGAALLFDAAYQPKPSHAALVDLFGTAPPVLAAANFLNSASYQGGAVSPGEIVTLFGANFGPSTLSGPTAGAQVSFDGAPAPILYSAVNQTALIVPFGVAGRANATVTYSYRGVPSNSVTVPVTATSPGLFSADSSGTGPGAILNQDNSLNSAANPAPSGTVVQLFGTGSGALSGGVTDGQIISVPLPQLMASVTATIGGLPAKVNYAGPAPSLIAGVLQVNLEVPMGLAAGPQPVLLKVGGVSTQDRLTVAIK